MQCKMIATSTGKQCKYQATDGTDYCRLHLKIKRFVFDKEQNDRWREFWKNSFAEDPLPSGAEQMVCGAKTRNGTPCMRRDLYPSGRCRLHGGLSTGPRTEEGKKKASLNWKKDSGVNLLTKSMKGINFPIYFDKRRISDG